MGKHTWRESDFLAQPAEAQAEGPGQRRFLFYGLLAAFGLLLALAAAWLTLGRLVGLGGALKPVTLLLVGVDERREDIGRTDTIILVTYNPPARKVNVVWIPRDTRVIVPGYNYHQKVNTAFSLGGVNLTRRTIEDLLQVKVDYHFLLDFRGFVEAVDALGGVTVKIDRPMDYDDRAQDLHIHLKPGEHRLSGQEALGFVRYRSDGLGDISLIDPVNKVYDGRIARQQQFLHAAARELLRARNVWRIPGLIRIAARSIETDMPLGRLLAYARTVGGLTRDGIVTGVLPGEGRTVAGAAYWVPENGATQEVAEEHRTVETLPPDRKLPSVPLPNLRDGLTRVVTAVAPSIRPLPPARVRVLNGTGEPGLAKRAAARLEKEGLVVASVDNADRFTTGPTQVTDLSGRADAVAKVRKVAPKLTVVGPARSGGDPERTDLDLVIVVGTDFRL